MDFPQFIISFALIIPSAIMHEYAHGWMADKLGDPTARYAGRLTLNPLAHIDPMGTFILPLMLGLVSGGSFMFAYAKPVPFNPYNLKYPRFGPAFVGAAGPFSNLLIATVFSLLVRFAPLPLPLLSVCVSVVFINVMLAVFNMVPIPPLDGSKVLFAMLPRSVDTVRMFLEKYGIILLFVFIFYGYALIDPIVRMFMKLFIGASF